MKYIGVFCSASDVDEKYVGPSREFSRLLAKHGYSLLWGGTDKGLMKVIADTARAGGSKLLGVSVPFLQNIARKDAEEMIITKDLGARKSLMLAKSDAIIALPGGTGTLDEILAIIEEKKLRLHDKPIVILNSAGFYEGLKFQLETIQREGFLNRPLGELVYIADTPEQAIEYIDRHVQIS